MMTLLLPVTLAASLMVGQSGGKPTKPKKPTSKPPAKLVKAPALEKLETDFGLNIFVGSPWEGLVTVMSTTSKATDAALEGIAKIDGLYSLRFENSSATNKGVAHLADATTLKVLFLNNNLKLTSACVADLAKLPKPETLQVERMPLHKATLKTLASMPSLFTLVVAGTGIKDADLAVFAGNTHIAGLILSDNAGIKGRGLESLYGMKRLSYIDRRLSSQHERSRRCGWPLPISRPCTMLNRRSFSQTEDDFFDKRIRSFSCPQWAFN
jgi:hypothetical protein